MNRINFKHLFPHLIALIVFISISAVYFYPVLQGYKIKQADIKQHKGMAHELRNHREEFNEEPLWIGNMFAGMPAYQVSASRYSGDILHYIHKGLQFGFAHPIGLLILYMIGFYILLLSLRINPWISLIGAIAFAFSSYFIVIIEAGHTSKAYAIAYMAPVLGGIISILRGRIWLGLIITSIFMGLELHANHLQITYYLILPILAVGIVEMIGQIQGGNINIFLKRALFVLIAVMIGVLPNMGNILSTYEYSKASTRSPSELTIKPDGSSNEDIKSEGLDKDYITHFSYGIEETFTLLFPNAKGGKTGAILADEELMKELRREKPQFFNFLVNQYQKERYIVDTYWGNLPFTSGPVYAGSIVVFLAFLALIFVRDRLVVALSIAALLAVLLSWGRNLMWFTDFFIEYVPLYNKFRAVSMILVVVELILPILAVLFLSKLYREKREFFLANKKKFFYSIGGFIALLLLFWVTPDTFFEFLSEDDKEQLREQIQLNAQNSGSIYDGFEDVVNYRIEVFKADILNILKYVSLATLLIFLYGYKKINSKVLLIGIGGLILIDLWSLNKNYLNNEEKPGASRKSADRYLAYQLPEQKKAPYTASPVDKAILQRELQENPKVAQSIQEEIQAIKQTNPRPGILEIEDVQYTELMRGTHFRVLNTVQKLDEDAQTAYFFKTLGGYHGAKMKKYQELIDFEIGIESFQLRKAFLKGGKSLVKQLLPRMNVTNMLNAKYIIGAEKTKQGNQLTYTLNPYALGNAWFVDDYEVVPDADKEIQSLADLDPAKKAIVRQEFKDELKDSYQSSPSDYIKMKSYLPNKMVYEYQAASERLAVFSEIYYKKGWNVYLNGKKLPYIKVNYILRGMEVPKGKGELVFKFEPLSYDLGQKLTWLGSFIMIVLIGGWFFTEWKRT